MEESSLCIGSLICFSVVASSDEFTPAEEDKKNSSSEQSSEGKKFKPE